MDTSFRLKCIKEIAERLSAEDWVIIDLTLKHYDLPRADVWNGSRHDYVIRMVEDATDDSLEELAKHLGIIEKDKKSIKEDSSIWQPRRFHMFISHASGKKKLAADLKLSLEAYYISGFVAHNDIKPTKKWEEEIAKALRSSHALIALLSKDFPKSEWADQEVGVSVGQGILVIPVMLGVEPYGFIKKYQGLQGEEKSVEQLTEDIFNILLTNKLTQNEITEAIVSKMEDSWNFEAAKNNVALLEQIPRLNSAHIKRLKSALETNRQIYNSFNVSDKLERLFQQHK